MTTDQKLSIAIETSSRQGGLALGVGDELVRAVVFESRARHAAAVVARLDELVRGAGFGPGDLDEVYVSAGPGSFTGIRVGVTVARTLAQALPRVKPVSVPSAWSVAQTAVDADWMHLAVLLAARDQQVYAQLFERDSSGQPVPACEGTVEGVAEMLARAPRPLMVTGEGLDHVELPESPDIQAAPGSLHNPTPEATWRVGRILARAGRYIEYHHLLPIYSRISEAERLWEHRQAKT